VNSAGVMRFMTKTDNNVGNCMVVMLVAMSKMNSVGTRNFAFKT
jgi:hypothetical protein